jgi:ABC-type transport system involved in multi-copper enzyme maturation permease subunit
MHSVETASHLFRAEWRKVIGNRWVVGTLLWIFPAGTFGILAIMILIALLAPPEIRGNFGLAGDTGSAPFGGPISWTSAMIGAWNPPTQIYGRFILIAFTAVIFAGEYQWGTWKNVLARNRRASIIVTKFVTLGVFVVLSFTATSLIAGIGLAIPVRIAGGSYGPAVSADVLKDFLGDYFIQAFNAFAATILAANYAALAAMVTRSILGSIMAGIGMLLLEMLSLGILSLLAYLFNAPRIVALFRWTPTYNLSNIVTWVKEQEPVFAFLTEQNTNNSPELSILVLLLWVVGLVAITTYLFQRQDITT